VRLIATDEVIEAKASSPITTINGSVALLKQDRLAIVGSLLSIGSFSGNF
jgi:hypothetical protein